MDYDLEKELLNYNDMGSSIDKIKKIDDNKKYKNNKKYKDDDNKFNINTFVQELEKNLDNFDEEPFASNQNFNKIKDDFTEKIVNFEDDDDEENNDGGETNDNWNNKIYNLLINIKEPLIIILLFILLNNNDLIELTYKIPFINIGNTQYPSLIIRGIILVSVIYYLRNV